MEILQIVVSMFLVAITTGAMVGRLVYTLIDKRLTKLEAKMESPPISDRFAALRMQTEAHNTEIIEKLMDLAIEVEKIKSRDDPSS